MRPAVLLCLAALAAGQQEAPTGVAGVLYPKPEPGFTQPVRIPCTVIQGNEGAFSHSDPIARFAWDYGIGIGTPVVATRAGVVALVRSDSNVGGLDLEKFRDEGNYVTLDHGDGTCSFYLHLRRGAEVRIGEYVLRGERIGYSGDTGYSGRPHLHYTAVDPRSRASIPSIFADFKKHGGVPVQGDSVKPGPAPKVDQEIIDLYKRAIRAARAALAAKHDAMAWEILADFPPRKVARGYFYENVRQAMLARLRKPVQTGAKPNKAEAAWRKGLRESFEGAPWDGLSEWGKALRLQRFALWEKTALEALNAWRRDIDRRCTRTKKEAAITLPNHRRRVFEDAEAWVKEAKEQSRTRRKLFPGEKDSARADDKRYRAWLKEVKEILNR